MGKTYKFKHQKSKREQELDYVKECRRQSRTDEMKFSHGFVSNTKVHSSKKQYSRKNFKAKEYLEL